MGRVLIATGIGLVLLGGLLLLAQRAGLPRLPGDLVYRRGNLTLFLPLGTSLLLSLLLTLVLMFLRKR
jgi:hypothetical protein